VIMLAQNPTENPLLEILGIDPAALKSILSALVNGTFGFASLVFLLLTTAGVFRRFTVPKDDKMAKRKALILSIASGVMTVALIFVWILLYFYVSQLQIGVRVYRGIVTNPLDTTNLTAPISIDFSAEGITRNYRNQKIISYNWDFDGDGEFDDGSGEVTTYIYRDKGDNEGIFNTGVRITFAKGNPVVIQKQVTIANILAEAKAKATPETGEAPLEVDFDASESSDPDGEIINYEWDFDGDGKVDATGEKVTHIFEKEGDFTVVLKLTDNNSGESILEKLIKVKSTGKPEVDFIIYPGTEGEIPFEISVDASGSSVETGQIIGYEWDFGDGTPTVKGKKAKHTYTRATTFNLALTVTDDTGKKETKFQKITVAIKKTAPTAIITSDPRAEIVEKEKRIEGEIPLEVSFSGVKSTDEDNNIVEFRWDFNDDGEIDEYGQDVIHTFVKEGEFTVVLHVIDADENEGTDQITVEVKEEGLVTKIFATPTSGPVPLEVSFDGSGSFFTQGSIISYKWNFGDGTSEVLGGAKQTHRYTEVGEYVVQLTITGDTGEKKTKELVIVVTSVELGSNFSYQPATGEAPLKVFFDASDSTGAITSYFWDFGDGGVSQLKKPSHTFQNSGEYTVVLEVSDAGNNISRIEKVVIVE
ncbi:MAG TPA: PKD domain-containing protein, partial [Candidatus Peregrinibacteria bacterium]|nr:PKD domain-containing protein [Candidatus Peregrinibacteria bacterium]